MTNDIKQAAEAIVDKYAPYTDNNNWRDKAILCAITEVEACMKYARKDVFTMGNNQLSDYEYLEQILEHLKQM